MNRALIKSRAKEFAFNNKWNIWKISIISALITYAIVFVIAMLGSMIGTVSITLILLVVASLGIMPLTIGMNYYLIKLVRGEYINPMDALFSKYNLVGLIIQVTVGISIFTSLWSILLYIPGIIYAFSVIMAPYLMADVANEQTTYSNVINASKHMMNGYKLDLFIFNLSFIGWILLGYITFGIALIWVVPYIQTANVMYYEELKKIKNIG